MNPERLLVHFERIAEAPDAVPRLRRFILDLAVRGKLVEQDPGDEPATELLRRIQTEKVRLLNAGEIRKSKANELKMVTAPYDLPRSWAWAALGSIFLYDAGAKREPNMLDQSHWLLELEDIEKDTCRLVTRVRASERASQSTKSEFKVGDILYGKLRPYLDKVLVADEPGYSTTEIVAIRSFAPLCSKYCALALRRPDFVEYVTRLGQGTKMPRLRTEDANVAPFPLPPLAEQHRIVAKVDELMAICDRLEAAQTEREQRRDRLVTVSLNRINQPAPSAEGEAATAFREHARFHLDHLPRLTTRLEHIKALRQTILNLAVRGRLVRQDPNDEPASNLLEAIAAYMARLVMAGKIRRQKGIARSASRLIGTLPSSWEPIALSDACQMVTSGSRGWAEFYADSGPAFIRAQNVRFGTLKLDDLAFVNPPSNSEGSRTKVAKGDLLIVITGAGVTNPAVLDRDLGEAYVSQHIGLVRPMNEQLSHWLLLCLMAPAGGRAELIERAYGAGKPGLNLDNIRSLSVPLPPLAEQQRIVAKVDELMAVCDQLEASLTATQTDSRRLLEVVLQEALAPAMEKAA